MKKFIIGFFCVLCWHAIAHAQNLLRGEILYLNSNKTPAVGVEVRGSSTKNDTANKVYTTDKGQYDLLFARAKKGGLVKLSIGDSDKNRVPIEVVNQRELKLAFIPEDSTQLFTVIVCKKGNLDVSTRKYYEIFKSASELEIKRMKDTLAVMHTREVKDQAKIEELTLALIKLQSENDSLRLMEQANRIAKTNLDFTSEEVRRYLTLLDSNGSVLIAREALNIELSAQKLKNAFTEFRHAIYEIELRADASESIYDYADALRCMDTIIHNLEQVQYNPLFITDYYRRAGHLLQLDGKSKEALVYQNKAIKILEQHKQDFKLEWADACHELASMYMALGEYKQAMQFELKVLDIIQEDEKVDSLRLAFALNEVGNLLVKDGKYNMAFKRNELALWIALRMLDPKDLRLSYMYDNIATTCNALGNFTKAVSYEKQCLDIRLKKLHHNDPLLAQAYTNMASHYWGLADYDASLHYDSLALLILESILHNEHPQLATTYRNIALTYRERNEFEKAIQYHLDDIYILERIYGTNHPDLASAYFHIASTFYQQLQFKDAFVYHQKALTIREARLSKHIPELISSYIGIAMTYRAMGDLSAGLTYCNKAKEVLLMGKRQRHLEWSMVQASFAMINLDNGNHKVALEYMRESISALNQIMAETHPAFIGVYENMVNILDANRMTDEAMRFRIKYIDAKEARSGPSIALLDDYSFVGYYYMDKKQFQRAFPYLERFNTLAGDSPLTYTNWVYYYCLQENYEQAMANLGLAIDLGFEDIRWLENNSILAGLRTLPDYEEIVNRVHVMK